MRNSDWQNQRTVRTRRPRRLEEVTKADVGVPIAWVIIGALAGLLVIGLVGLGVVNIVRKQSITPTPSPIPGLAPTQAIVQATPDQVQPQATPTIPPVVTLPPTPTPPPTETPLPVPPDELAPGGYAKVTGTEEAGLSLRAGPGTNNARLATIPENATLLILDGPREDENLEGYTWWFLRDADGTEGWAVQDFLVPSLPPETE
jgi:hypothetical protein